jgi:WD40 repeat protein
VASGGWEGGGEASGRAVAASCSFDGTVRLWDIGGGAGSGRCVSVLHSDKGKYLSSFSITPDVRRVVVGELGQGFRSGTKNVFIWTGGCSSAAEAAAAGTAAQQAWWGSCLVLAGHTELATAVQVSRDGTRVVSASEDGTLRVWQVTLDTTSADDIAPPRLLRAGSAVLSLATSADASTAFLGGALGRSERLQNWHLEFGFAVASLEDAPIDYWPPPLCSSLVDNGGEGTDGTFFSWARTTARSPSGRSRRGHVPVRVKGVGFRAGVKSVAARVVTGNTRSGGDGDDGVELVTGHYDKSVRVYSAGGRVSGEGGAAVGAAAEPTLGEVSVAELMGAQFDVYCFESPRMAPNSSLARGMALLACGTSDLVSASQRWEARAAGRRMHASRSAATGGSSL